MVAATLLLVTASSTPVRASSKATAGSEAQAAVAALQQWYNGSNGQFNTTGWWNSANALNAIVDYTARTGDTSYLGDLGNSFAVNASGDFLNGFYDDEGWWALTWINAYDLTGDPRYLSMAKSIFTDMTGGWDNTCGGGIWWNKARTYKNAIANELFLTVAIRLHQRTPGDQQYLSWANREWTWFQQTGMINPSKLINDGLDFTTCKNNNGTVWSYNQGVILGALTDLYRSTLSPAYLTEAESIANAAMQNLVNAQGILQDPCEPSSCNADETQFKGIFMRNLFYLYRVDHSQAYLRFIQTNADSIWADDRNSQNHFGVVWAGPFDKADASRQSSALDALNAALPVSPIPAPATAGLSTTQVRVTPGGSGSDTVAVQNITGQNIAATVTITGPAGITVSPLKATVPVGAGDASNVSLQVSAASGTPQNFYRVAIDVKSAGMALPTRYLTVLVAAPQSLLRSYNNVGISSDQVPATANFDGLGFSYSAQALAVAGLTPGATITEDGTTLTWPSASPGYPDNIVAGGQTVPVEAPAGTAQIGFLGAAAGGPSLGELTLNYSDGSSSHFELTLSDWTLNGGNTSPTGGNVPVATTTYRNCDCETSQTLDTYVFYSGLPVDTSRTLTSITFPASANAGSLHVFSIGASTTAVTGPVLVGLQPGTVSAGQQVTVTGSGFGATQGTGYVALTDGGNGWGAPGNAGTLQVDSWSDGAITFTVPGSTASLPILPGSQATVTVATSGGAMSNTGVLEITPTANLADYYDNIGISPDNNQACANIDGDGFSLSANLLAADGLTPGATVTLGGVSYVWPNVAACSADNILAAGQTMLVQGSSGATTLGLLGTSTSGSTQGTVVIAYTDGTSSSQTVNLNDWAGGSGGGDTAVATMPYRNSNSGNSQSLTVYVYATTVPGDPSKTVSSITLPNIGSTVAPSVKGMHIFAVGLG